MNSSSSFQTMKRLMGLLPALLALAWINSGCVMYPAIPGSGNIISESREVSGFHAVSFGGAGSVRITQGATESLRVEADDNLLPYLRTEVSGGELRVDWKQGNLRFTKPPVYTLEVKELDALHLSGSLHAKMDRLNTERFESRISGSGKIVLGTLTAREVSFQVSGSGDLDIAGGQADSLDIGISGSGNAQLSGFEVKEAKVSISGSGNAELQVAGQLDARVSGSGDVTYYGSPTVNSSISGSGRVHRGER